MPIDWRTTIGPRDDVVTVDHGGPRGRPHHRAEHVDGGGLAGAVRAEELEDLGRAASMSKSTPSTAVKSPNFRTSDLASTAFI